jgi:sRNA-binding regulator protein Hfq
MSISAIFPTPRNQPGAPAGRGQSFTKLTVPGSPAFHTPAPSSLDEAVHRQAEVFYLQKQIQSHTPMVIVLEDGEHIEGCIEWYDRHSLKVRGRTKTLIYKSAIKYMYKVGEGG